MAKEKVTFKKISKGQGKICPFCKEPALWEALYNGSSIFCCGSKKCQKKAGKYVK